MFSGAFLLLIILIIHYFHPTPVTISAAYSDKRSKDPTMMLSRQAKQQYCIK